MWKDFNPHLPCGRRRLKKVRSACIRCISIHTFLAEGDIPNPINSVQTDISIHTFLAEGDGSILYKIPFLKYFNPHLPCGRRQISMRLCQKSLDFNPHLPCGRRPMADNTVRLRINISIHTFLAEGDSIELFDVQLFRNFNPHLPCGRRPRLVRQSASRRIFQSTPSLRKATRNPRSCNSQGIISIHTFLAEGDFAYEEAYDNLKISIHTFLAEGDNCVSPMKPTL